MLLRRTLAEAIRQTRGSRRLLSTFTKRTATSTLHHFRPNNNRAKFAFGISLATLGPFAALCTTLEADEAVPTEQLESLQPETTECEEEDDEPEDATVTVKTVTTAPDGKKTTFVHGQRAKKPTEKDLQKKLRAIKRKKQPSVVDPEKVGLQRTD